MLNNYAPHRWISWRGIRFIVLLAFYLAFIVGVYALVKLGGTFIHPSPTDLLSRRLYIAAAAQGALFCIATGALAHALETFRIITQQKSSKK